MLPKTWYIICAPVADQLTKAAFRARNKGDFEMAALLYVQGRRIKGCRLLRNLSKKPSSYECDYHEYTKAINNRPKWATSYIFFHSHPISEGPSCSDVRSAGLKELNVIFDCVSGTFHMYRYTRSIRKEAKKSHIGETWIKS